MIDENKQQPSDIEELIERAHRDAHQGATIPQGEDRETETQEVQMSEKQRERRDAVLKRINDLTEDTSSSSLNIGSWLKSNRSRLFRRFGIFGIYCIFLLGLSIMWGYQFSIMDKKVGRLERDLEDIRYKSLFTTAELIKHERISNIETNIQSLNLNLESSTHPPYEIIDQAPQTTQ
ncbi:MAG: FtsL-like putative cell division protein [Porphyromonadaceae bacterium]|nr:FtsL-like putative cell division protein [Porphyromonadaceae bacterium]